MIRFFLNILKRAMVIAVTYDPPEPAAGRIFNSAILQEHRSRVVRSVQEALEGLGHTVAPFPLDLGLEGALKRIVPRVAFNLSTHAPRILEGMGIPFTGSPAAACASAVDKARAKAILGRAGIPMPKCVVIRDEKAIGIPAGLAFPLFAKPARGGCSRGIHEENLIVEESAFAETIQRIYRRVNGPLLVEEFLPGREFSVGILGNENLRILPVREFLFAERGGDVPFRSFRRKMIDFRMESTACPAELSPGEGKRVGELALEAYRCLCCRDYARIDMRLDRDGDPRVLDVNVLPNLVRGTSSFVIMAEKAGLAYGPLIGQILELACRRGYISCDGGTGSA